MRQLLDLPGVRDVRRRVRDLGADKRRAKKRRRALADLDQDARRIIEQVHPYTMMHPEKLFGLITAVRHVAKHDIPGAIVECGVWRGGGMMAAAQTLLDHGRNDVDIYLYDTYSGMSAPTEKDTRIDGRTDARAEFERLRTGADSSDWCFASLTEVQANLAKIPYPTERLHFVEGKVEDTIPETIPEKISILRLDTDWYESTIHEMTHLMPRLTKGGVLIADDYFGWAGNRDGVDEYLEAQNIPIMLTRVGRSAMGVRP